MTSNLSMPSVSAMVRRSSANAKHGVVLIRRRRPDAGPVDTDQPDLPLLGVDAGLHRDLPAGARRAVQPEDGAALRIAELGEPDLTVIADGDVAFQLRTGDCDSHAQSVSRGLRGLPNTAEQVRPHRGDAVVSSFVVHDGANSEHAVGAGHRFGLDAERTRLATRKEHHMRRDALEAIGSGELRLPHRRRRSLR